MRKSGYAMEHMGLVLDKRRAIVTGGVSGIGCAAVEALCEAGATVAVMDISPGVADVSKSIHECAIGLQCDLLDRKQRKQAFDRALALLGGRVDILVNSAGLQHKAKILDFADEAWDRVLELNLNCVFSLCKYAGAHMVEQRYGKIINIASMNSFFGGTDASAYSVSKGAVVQFTKAIANEWSQYGVNANAIAPGFIKTSMTDGLYSDLEYRRDKTKRIPAGRWGEPDDLKGAFVFLASQASDYLCGTVIPVDGGYLCK